MALIVLIQNDNVVPQLFNLFWLFQILKWGIGYRDEEILFISFVS